MAYGDEGIKRIQIGVGRDKKEPKNIVTEHVLSNFTESQLREIGKTFETILNLLLNDCFLCELIYFFYIHPKLC